MRLNWAFLTLCFTIAALSSQKANAAPGCINKFLNKVRTLGFAPEDVVTLARGVAEAVGENPDTLKVMPCEDSFKIDSWYADPSEHDVPPGGYILYNENWIRESVGYNWSGALGPQRKQWAVVLIGHELGHLQKQHFTVRRSLSMLEKEVEADSFAGCAAAAYNVPWQAVEDILSNIREDKESTYPARQRSLAVAQQGFNRCVGKTVAAPAFRLRAEMQQAVNNNDAESVAALLSRGADPNMPLSGNMAAAEYAWQTGQSAAFNQLVLGGAKLGGNPALDGLVIKMVRDDQTPPEVLRAAIKNGAPVKPDPTYGFPACIAARSVFFVILREAGYTCPAGKQTRLR